MDGAFLKLDPSNMIKTSKQIKLKINIQTEIAGQELAEEIEKRTDPYIPFLHGYLEGSFTYNLLLPPPLMLIRVRYSAISHNLNSYDYNYAARQHEDSLHHPVRKIGKRPTDHFLTKGMFDVKQVTGRIYGRNIQKVLG